MIVSSTLFILPQDKDMPLFFIILIKEKSRMKPNFNIIIARHDP